MEEKVNNITINLTSLVDYIKDKDFEIENWRYKHLKEFKEKKKLQEKLNKIEEYLKNNANRELSVDSYYKFADIYEYEEIMKIIIGGNYESNRFIK